MTKTVAYHWHLRKVMNEHGMQSTTDLVPLLADRGVVMTSTQVYRIVVGQPERLNMAFLAAIAGMVFTAYLNAANPKDGVGFELDAIAAVFIGGAAVAGGVGTVTGSMIGGLVMAVMSNGMQLQGVQVPTQQIVKGLVLLLAVAFDVWNKRRAAAAKS